jgi:hypothetical protein
MEFNPNFTYDLSIFLVTPYMTRLPRFYYHDIKYSTELHAAEYFVKRPPVAQQLKKFLTFYRA